jgi:hypothetical protein
MDNTNPRTSAGVLLPLPMSIGLVVLFFMPWLTLSCDGEAATNTPGVRSEVELPEEFSKTTVLARASGWDLARGELTPDDRFKEMARQAQQSQNQEGPTAKPWAYGGLVLPGIVAVFSLVCLAGKLTSSGTGKWLLLLSVAGVVLMILAVSVDYVDMAMDKAKDEMAAHGMNPRQPGLKENMAEAASMAKEVIQTKTTPYLWACLGIYVLIGGCGLAAMGSSQSVEAAEPEATWQRDTADAEEMPALAERPSRERRAPSDQFSFGPDILPREDPVQPAGEKVDSQT